MKKLITENGKTMEVPSDVTENYMYEQGVIVDEGMHLEKQWNVSLYEHNGDYVTEKMYDHKPTDDELIFFMIQNGVGCNRYCVVLESFRMEMKWNDEEEGD